MASISTASINLSALDKSKIVKTDKNGKPFKNGAQYYTVTILINDEADQYGNNVQIIEPQTKEQRDAKEKRTFLGNGRVNWASAEQKKSEPQPTAKAQEPETDLPF